MWPMEKIKGGHSASFGSELHSLKPKIAASASLRAKPRFIFFSTNAMHFRTPQLGGWSLSHALFTLYISFMITKR